MIPEAAGPQSPSALPLRLNVVLEEGFRVAKKIFWPMLGVTLLTHSPGLLSLGIGYLALDSGAAVDIDPYWFAWTLVGALCGFAIFQTLAEPLSVGATYIAAERCFQGRRSTMGELLMETLRRFGPIFGVGALYYGGVYGLAGLCVGGLFAVGSAVLVALQGETVLALVLSLGGGFVSLVTFPTTVWFMLRFGFCLTEVVGEPEKPPMGSFSRSAQLMRGAYLPVIALILLLMAVQSGLLLLVGSLFPSIPMQVTDPDTLFEKLPSILRAQLLHQAAAVTTSTIYSIYAGACWVAAYRQRKQAVEAQTAGTTAAPATP